MGSDPRNKLDAFLSYGTVRVKLLKCRWWWWWCSSVQRSLARDSEFTFNKAPLIRDKRCEQRWWLTKWVTNPRKYLIWPVRQTTSIDILALEPQLAFPQLYRDIWLISSPTTRVFSRPSHSIRSHQNIRHCVLPTTPCIIKYPRPAFTLSTSTQECQRGWG